MKAILNDEELQKLSDDMREFLSNKYKDEIDDIPDSVLDVLCQNYIINCKNGNINVDELFENYNITEKV